MDIGTFRRKLQHHMVEEERARGAEPSVALLRDLTNRIAAEDLLPDQPFEPLYTELVRESMLFGPLWRPYFDNEVSEIMVNGPDRVFVERHGRIVPSEVTFRDEHELRHTVDKIMSLDTAARLDQSKPWVDLALPDGSRANVTIPPIAHGGIKLTIRKYQGAFRGVEDLVANGTLDGRMAELLVAATRARLNILFSGATATGKTTLLEVLTRIIPEGERILCIEDTMELHIEHPNVVRLLTRLPNLEGKGEISIGDLFRNSLRMCPDRVLLGEIRGKEAYDYLQALNSGHDGSLAVLHASSPEEALVRLQNLVPLAGLAVPGPVVKRQIAHGLDLVVQLAQLADGSRRVTRITEVGALGADGEIALHDLFRFDIERNAPTSAAGKFRATGQIPDFLPILARSGMDVAPAMFTEG